MKNALLCVDITNQYYSVRNLRQGARIDYGKYLQQATKDFNLFRAFAYGVEMGDEANSFKTVLRSLGYEPRYRQALVFGDQCDLRRTDRNLPMAMDIWRSIDRVDAVIIGSSDPELVPVIQRIKELAIQTIVFSFNISAPLKQVADRYIEANISKMEHIKNEAGPATQ